ncbi:hypothetical protein YC2023_113045 [Brassica napus]
MILSPPHADHNPSMKFSSPDNVTLLSFLSPSYFIIFFSIASLSSPSSSSSFFLFFLCPVRLREQSISSITIIDLVEVSISNLA